MILTGPAIREEVEAGRVVISPFDPDRLEPNSYGFSLGRRILWYESPVIDPLDAPVTHGCEIPKQGLVLSPNRLYLGETYERMGSDHYAATLYANRSVGCLGMWIQMSAPLGHTGAIIPWTLEIRVVNPVVVFPGMLIGKIAFWVPQGAVRLYEGKYDRSNSVVESRIATELGDFGRRALEPIR